MEVVDILRWGEGGRLWVRRPRLYISVGEGVVRVRVNNARACEGRGVWGCGCWCWDREIYLGEKVVYIYNPAHHPTAKQSQTKSCDSIYVI